MSGHAVKSILDGAEIIQIDPATIDVSGRIGDFFPDKATALGRLMLVDGQKTPINVSRLPAGGEFAWKLHVGMHRVAGARFEGLDKVFAIVVSGKPEELAKLEASENLERRTPEPLERAKFTAALVMATQERIAREHGGLKQHQLAVKARWAKVRSAENRAEEALAEEVTDTCATIAHVYGWEESVSEALGMSRRSIHNDLQLYRLIVEPFPFLSSQLAQHPIVGRNAKQLRDIAQVQDEGQRRLVIEALLADTGLNADDARINVGIDRPAGPAPLPHQKHVNAVVGGLGRMTATLQKRHLGELVGSLKSDEVKKDLRELLAAELGEEAKPVSTKPIILDENLRSALEQAFGVLAKLAIGEEPVDDDEIEAARSTAQQALFECHGAAIETETADGR